MSKDAYMYDITNISESSLKHRVTKPSIKKNVKYLSQKTVNMMAVDIRLKKEITKTMNKLKKNSAEMDSEIVRYQTRHIPDAKYQLSKRKNMCKKLETMNEEFLNNMNILEDQLNDIKENKRIMEYELNNKFDREINDCENEYKSTLYETIDKYEVELTELDRMPPKDQLEKEINDARQKIIDLLEEIDNIKLNNEENVKMEKDQLKLEFQKLQNDSLQLLDELKDQSEKYIVEKDQVLKEQKVLVESIEKLNQMFNIEQDSLNSLQVESDELNITNTTLLNRNNEMLQEVQNQEIELTLIQANAVENDNKYNDEYNKMETELARRKKLENSIDELKGLIRCFAYMDSTKFNSFTIDYLENVVIDERDDIYPFNRIVPSNALSIPQLIFREYKAYHDLCLNENNDFSLFTVSNTDWSEFKTQFIEFLSHEFSNDYDITSQNVFLSDEKMSKDLIKLKLSEKNNIDNIPIDNVDNAENNSSCINIKFEGNNLIMNTKAISIENYKSNLEENRIDYDSNHGINLFKFQFKRRNDQNCSINFHLINFENLELLYDIRQYFNVYKPKNSTSHVGHVINRLINQIKSCFIFNFDSLNFDNAENGNTRSSEEIDEIKDTEVNHDEVENEKVTKNGIQEKNEDNIKSENTENKGIKLNEIMHKMLELASKIGQIPNPQNRR